MTGAGRLERGYRRLLACYPAAYRREYEDEILGVLLAGARAGRRHVGLAEAADLLTSALRMWLRPPSRPPRVVRATVWLMCAGAVAHLAAALTVAVTAGGVRSAVSAPDPARWRFLDVHIVAVEVVAPLAIGVWLWSAWAHGRGDHRAGGAIAGLWGLVSLGLLGWLAGGAATAAPADLLACATVWLIQLAAIILVVAARGRVHPAGGASPR